MKNKIILILHFLLILNAKQNQDKIEDFVKSYFQFNSPKADIFPIKSGLESFPNEIPVLFKNTDSINNNIFTISKDRKVSKILSYNKKSLVYNIEYQELNFSPLKQISIKNVYCGNDQSCLLYVLFDGIKNYKLVSYLMESNKLIEKETHIFINSIDQSFDPVYIQYWSDMLLKSFFLIQSDSGLYLININDSFKINKIEISDLFEKSQKSLEVFNQETAGMTLNTQGLNMMIDLNNDCNSDLVLTFVNSNGEKKLIVLIFQETNFKFANSFVLDSKSISYVFSDFNKDQILDFLVLNDDMTLNIYYGSLEMNKEVQCQKTNNILKFPKLSNKEPSDFSISLLTNVKVYEDKPSYIFFKMMLADLTLSGYDDIIINTISSGKKKVYIFKNESSSGGENSRTFVDKTNDIFKVFENKETIKTFLFDFGSRGFVN